MNQTPKLIFRKMNFVTAKHMKTFSFPEMVLREPNTALVFPFYDSTPLTQKKDAFKNT